MAFVIACVDTKEPKNSDFVLLENDDVEVFFKRGDAERAVAELKEEEGPGVTYHILEVK